MVMTGKRHDFFVRYDVGFDDDGRIRGIEMDLAARCGMSPDLSNAIVDRAMFHADNAYFLGNARITGHRCKTHTVSNTAYRGFGGPQGDRKSVVQGKSGSVRVEPGGRRMIKKKKK